MCGTCEEIFSEAERLESVGLTVPQITKLMLELKRRGFDVNTAVYTVDSAEAEIKRLLAGGAK